MFLTQWMCRKKWFTTSPVARGVELISRFGFGREQHVRSWIYSPRVGPFWQFWLRCVSLPWGIINFLFTQISPLASTLPPRDLGLQWLVLKLNCCFPVSLAWRLIKYSLRGLSSYEVVHVFVISISMRDCTTTTELTSIILITSLPRACGVQHPAFLSGLFHSPSRHH